MGVSSRCFWERYCLRERFAWELASERVTLFTFDTRQNTLHGAHDSVRFWHETAVCLAMALQRTAASGGKADAAKAPARS